jgi:transcriptional regulator with XRE-family HTH domain
MGKDLGSPRHEALRLLLRERRRRADMTQYDLAAKLGRPQSYVSAIEKGQQRVSVLEFLEFAEAIGFDAPARYSENPGEAQGVVHFSTAASAQHAVTVRCRFGGSHY